MTTRDQETNTAGVVSRDHVVEEVLACLKGTRKLGQQREPRWLHPFPARLPTSIAEYLISSLTDEGATVLDPMVGSGTSLVAARRSGRGAIGIDRDHLAVRISRCSASGFESDRLEALNEEILCSATETMGDRGFRLESLRANLDEEDNDFIRYWFPWRSQRGLFALARAINDVSDELLRDFAWVVFSSLIIAKSAGASHALDISRSRPHKRSDKAVIDPLAAWQSRFRSAMSRLPFLDEERGDVRVHHGDARSLPLEEHSADLVITSPPYDNAIDYIRSHKFSLLWMGHDLASLRELRGTMIGSERGLWQLDGLPDDIEDRIERTSGDARRRARLRRYLSDLRQTLLEQERVLRPGGLAVLVVGPTILNKSKADAVSIVGSVASSTGLRVVASVVRRLNADRRSLPLLSKAAEANPLSMRMRREVIVALRK